GGRVENASGFSAGIGVAGNRATIGATNATPIDFMSGSIARMTVDPSGNIGVGTKTPVAMLHVAGNIQVDGNIAAKYQGVAEWVKSAEDLPGATVVIIDPREPNLVTISNNAYDTRVAGVESLKPGLLLGEGGERETNVAR